MNHLRDLYREKRLNNKLVPSQERREGWLISKSNRLLHALKYSILTCGNGAACKSKEENKLSADIVTLGEDMVWNPLFKRWNCIKCYNFYYRTEAQKQELQDILNQREEEERVFDKWLSRQIDHD